MFVVKFIDEIEWEIDGYGNEQHIKPLNIGWSNNVEYDGIVAQLFVSIPRFTSAAAAGVFILFSWDQFKKWSIHLTHSILCMCTIKLIQLWLFVLSRVHHSLTWKLDPV